MTETTGTPIEIALSPHLGEATYLRTSITAQIEQIANDDTYTPQGRQQLIEPLQQRLETELQARFEKATAELDTKLAAVEAQIAAESIAERAKTRELLATVPPVEIELIKTVITSGTPDSIKHRFENETDPAARLLFYQFAEILLARVEGTDSLLYTMRAALPVNEKLQKLEGEKAFISSAKLEANRRLNPGRENELAQRFKIG